MRVTLTRTGRSVIEKARSAYERWYAEFVEGLPDIEITKKTITASIARLEK